MNNELALLECVSSAEASVYATTAAADVLNDEIQEAVIEQQQQWQQQHRHCQRHQHHQAHQQQQHQHHNHHQNTPASLAFGEASNSAGGNTRRAATTIRTCRYFLRGTCRHGASCKFSHNATEDGDISTPDSNNINNYNDNNIGILNRRSNRANSLTRPNILAAITSPSHTSIADSNKQKNYAKLVKWAEAPAFVPRNPRMISTLQDIETEALSAPNQSNQQQQEQEQTTATAPMTWAQVVSGGKHCLTAENNAATSVKSLCPYRGYCPYADKCVYALHWELCKMCDKYCLHPTDTEQRRRHNKKCLQRHEEDMEISFAVARSRDKVCGICMEVILEMPRGMRRFGILPQCNHVFCLGCIRKWRQMPDFSHSVTRSCPQCRVTSSFICPSLYWVDTKEQKDQLIKDYRTSLGRKDCKYFKMGKGKCPFGSRCFYRHALPNGEKVDDGSSVGGCGGTNRMRKVTAQTNRNNEVRVLNLVDFCLWDFVEQRDMSCVDSLLQGNNFVSVVDYDTDSD